MGKYKYLYKNIKNVQVESLDKKIKFMIDRGYKDKLHERLFELFGKNEEKLIVLIQNGFILNKINQHCNLFIKYVCKENVFNILFNNLYNIELETIDYLFNERCYSLPLERFDFVGGYVPSNFVKLLHEEIFNIFIRIKELSENFDDFCVINKEFFCKFSFKDKKFLQFTEYSSIGSLILKNLKENIIIEIKDYDLTLEDIEDQLTNKYILNFRKRLNDLDTNDLDVNSMLCGLVIKAKHLDLKTSMLLILLCNNVETFNMYNEFLIEITKIVKLGFDISLLNDKIFHILCSNNSARRGKFYISENNYHYPKYISNPNAFIQCFKESVRRNSTFHTENMEFITYNQEIMEGLKEYITLDHIIKNSHNESLLLYVYNNRDVLNLDILALSLFFLEKDNVVENFIDIGVQFKLEKFNLKVNKVLRLKNINKFVKVKNFGKFYKINRDIFVKHCYKYILKILDSKYN